MSGPDAWTITLTDPNGRVLYWCGSWFTSEPARACRYSGKEGAEKEARRINRLGQASIRKITVVPHPIQASKMLEEEL